MEPIIIKNNRHKDNRGFFEEIFNTNYLKSKYGIFFTVKQINISNSKIGVIRGLHYQYPKAQSKIVYVLSGEIYDVVVDLRKKSKNYLKYKTYLLKENDNKLLYVPKGFAHGFLSLKNNTRICYFVDNFWSKDNEKTLAWNSKEINIKWPSLIKKKIILSKKDRFNDTID
jgi:dTDP-4-dehydrorhamnose 3,5-epimerase